MTSLSRPETPPAGGPAFAGPKTCDASAMVEIHRALRRSFDEATALVDGVAEGDTKHAAAVATQLHLISAALHAHHEGEDARLWGTVSERAPACVLHVDRMKRQHAGMLVHLEKLDQALPAWRATAAKDAAEPVRAAVGGVSAAMAEHFPDEEATIVPAMEHVLTPREEKWFAKHGRAATPKGQLWHMLGAILAAQPDGGDAWLKKNMPGPVALIWRWIGAPRYARFRAALEGRG
ncbi:hemerythrin domain-containing protein [Actinacidiphila bryophytorum]|uniref:hemerythrin domain-containing protein n=1 Tax=Actinacidiphila bryophytorum TaxID=1436133 RepID=UPI002176E0DC|nr:hemerythrin domain-containing protein [Actinacidiphila bryophytorum]UWE13327.1 hemerythrin domain-containing protein [Actinacidiphila bryophytorum]